MFNAAGSVVRDYTYDPFGGELDFGADNSPVPPSNWFMFTGQWFDDEIKQYYLRARMYDPKLMRFTSRNPVKGKTQTPLTLHIYLYCLNDPTNGTDPEGLFVNYYNSPLMGAIRAGVITYNEGLRTAVWAADSGNWKFFDVSADIFVFMPMAMAYGAAFPTFGLGVNMGIKMMVGAVTRY